jgi:hypothetical protein
MGLCVRRATALRPLKGDPPARKRQPKATEMARKMVGEMLHNEEICWEFEGKLEGEFECEIEGKLRESRGETEQISAFSVAGIGRTRVSDVPMSCRDVAGWPWNRRPTEKVAHAACAPSFTRRTPRRDERYCEGLIVLR